MKEGMKRSWLVLLQQYSNKKKRNKGETDAFSFEAKEEKEKSDARRSWRYSEVSDTWSYRVLTKAVSWRF